MVRQAVNGIKHSFGQKERKVWLPVKPWKDPHPESAKIIIRDLELFPQVLFILTLIPEFSHLFPA